MLFSLYCVGIFLTERLSLKACYSIAEVVAKVYYYVFSRNDKLALRDNLRMVIGKDADKEILDAHVFKNIY